MFKQKPLVICGPPRSGSHFLFNSIRVNAEVFDFPISNDMFYSSIEHILLPGDDKISHNWTAWFKRLNKENKYPILRTNCLPNDLKTKSINIGIVTVSSEYAQKVTELLINGGITAILNYTPSRVQVPEEVELRNINPVLFLQSMTYHLKKLFDEN